MDVKVEKSKIELRLLLRATRVPNNEDSPNSPKEWNVSYIGRTLEQGLRVFQLPEYNKVLPLVLFIHGFNGSADKHKIHFIAMLRSGYRERFNLMALNMPLYFEWNPGNLWYLLPAFRAKLVGEAVGELLVEAASQGLLAPGQIHVVGYSLGAQTAGYIARAARGNVASIVGLDPAGPGFDTNWKCSNLLTHVSRSDAPVVYMYHTNSGSLGSSRRTAKVDVVFNNGWHQPGCGVSNIFCSHRLAPHFFAQVVRRPARFEARRCSSYKAFKSCKCRDNEILQLSFPPDPEAEGTFYLKTSYEFPYGKGHFGALCPKRRKTLLLNSTFSEKHVSFHEKLAALKSYTFLNKSYLKGINSKLIFLKGSENQIEEIPHYNSQLHNTNSHSKLRDRGTYKQQKDLLEEKVLSDKIMNKNLYGSKTYQLLKKSSLKEVLSEKHFLDNSQPAKGTLIGEA